MKPQFSSLLLATALATTLGLRAQSGFPTSVNPKIPDDHKSAAFDADAQGMPVAPDPQFTGKPLPGERAGTERWIVHFKTAPYSLDAYSAEMHGAKDPARVAQLVADIDRRMRIGRAGFVADVQQLGGVVADQWWIVNAAVIEIAPGQLAAVRALPNVAYLQPDVETHPLIKTATNAANHNSDLLQAKGIRGSKVGVAIIDTSFDDNMNGTGRPHIAFSKNGSTTVDRFCYKQKIGSQPFDDPHPHGTGVASIAAGYKWKSATADYGHAYDAEIAALSIANASNGNSSTSNMATAYNAIATIAAKCKIVSSNLSYSGSSNPLSVEQKAMDNLALKADVVNATAAGNSGSSVSSSLANINGLSVAAVNENSHTLASFSSRGFQGGRYFPNISANGVSTNMAKQNDETSDYIASGTSMASPMVCGGAALVRDANTALTADETIAILLASTEGNAGSAATIQVNGVGAGYMKLDAAYNIAENVNGHGRRTLSNTTKTYTRTIQAKSGVAVQCAIKWLRHDVNSTSWANLDLALLRGATVLVNSNTTLNTEEFVRYVPKQNETLTMRVTLVSLGTGQTSQTFGWACEGAGAGFKPGKYTLYGAGCKGSGKLTPHVIVPRAYASKMGSSANTYPHARADMRYQQVFLGSEFGASNVFDQVALRLDETYGGSAETQNLTVKMGHTTRTPATLGTSFAGNYTGAVTTVFSGTLNLPAHAGGGTIASWGPTIKFSKSFVYNGTQNVIIELVNTSASASSWFADFASGNDATTTRAYAFGATSTTATSVARNQGLVMCFESSGAVPAANTVLPRAFASKMASSSNTYPHARANMRYQQVFLRSEVGLSTKVFNEMCLRKDETSGGPALSQKLAIYLGYTSRSYTNLSSTFATNVDSGALTSVFSGSVFLPASAGGGTISTWQPCIKFTTPFVWSPAKNRNFLVEVRNTSPSSTSHFEDFCYNEAGATTRRVWSTASATAATGSIDANPGGLVMCFRSSASGTNVSPVLGNIGVPEIAKSFTITLAQARPNSVGLLFFGARQNIPLGACTSYASGLVILGVPTNSAGYGAFTLPVPNNTALIGGKFANQYWVLDSQGALLNTFALTNGGEGEIGG